jgi:hypothetical protein
MHVSLPQVPAHLHSGNVRVAEHAVAAAACGRVRAGCRLHAPAQPGRSHSLQVRLDCTAMALVVGVMPCMLMSESFGFIWICESAGVACQRGLTGHPWLLLRRNVVNVLSEASNNAHPTHGEQPTYTTFNKVRSHLRLPIWPCTSAAAT